MIQKRVCVFLLGVGVLVPANVWPETTSEVTVIPIGNLARYDDSLDAAWSPKGAEVAAATQTGLYVYRLEDETTSRIVSPFFDDLNMDTNFGDLRWSPDGDRIAFSWKEGGPTAAYPENIWIVNNDGNELRRLTNSAVYIQSREEDKEGRMIALQKSTHFRSPCWGPGGKAILYVMYEVIDSQTDAEKSHRIFQRWVMSMNLMTGIQSVVSEISSPGPVSLLAYRMESNEVFYWTDQLYALSLQSGVGTSETVRIVQSGKGQNQARALASRLTSPQQKFATTEDGKIEVLDPDSGATHEISVAGLVAGERISRCIASPTGNRILVELESPKGHRTLHRLGIVTVP